MSACSCNASPRLHQFFIMASLFIARHTSHKPHTARTHAWLVHLLLMHALSPRSSAAQSRAHSVRGPASGANSGAETEH